MHGRDFKILFHHFSSQPLQISAVFANYRTHHSAHPYNTLGLPCFPLARRAYEINTVDSPELYCVTLYGSTLSRIGPPSRPARDTTINIGGPSSRHAGHDSSARNMKTSLGDGAQDRSRTHSGPVVSVKRSSEPHRGAGAADILGE